jgi:fumarate reductase subunit D
MIENINDYLIITACFFLLFFLVFLLVERYNNTIRNLFEKYFQLSTKIPDKKISKILFVWGTILIIRKLVYYVPLQGVMQTKFSVWWIREDILIYQTFVFALFLLGISFLGIIIGFFSDPWERYDWTAIVYPVLLLIVGIRGIFALLEELNIEYMSVEQVISTPLLFLKMLCSGKYLGLLTSLAVSIFILNRHKKMKYKINKRTIKYLKVPWIILLSFLTINFYIFPGDWEYRFEQKCQAAISQYTFEELMEAANSISDNTDKSNALKILALWIARRGNIQWAEAVARSIPDTEIKSNTLTEIRRKKEKK